VVGRRRPGRAVARPPVDLRGSDHRTVARFSVTEGERVPFVLTWAPSHEGPPEPVDAEQALSDTLGFWRDWLQDCSIGGPYADAVRRSLVVLKALTYLPTGGIAAAVTTSLPEQIGGVRNWDYRYCWLRDASSTLQALAGGGYTAEARACATGCCVRSPATRANCR